LASSLTPDQTTEMTVSHLTNPAKDAGQVIGYSHSTKLSKDDSQVAGYSRAHGTEETTSQSTKPKNARQVAGYVGVVRSSPPCLAFEIELE
jgi:hypothetical protein